MMRRKAMQVLMLVVCAACGRNASVPSAAGPSVTRLVPESGPVGTAVTIAGSGFASTQNVVRFGSGYVGFVDSGQAGTVIQFTVPQGLELCAPGAVLGCVQAALPPVLPGEYTVSVTAGGAASEVVEQTIAGQHRHLLGAHTIATHELGRDAQLLHLAQHRTADCINTTEEDRVRLLGFDGSEDGAEIGRLVMGELAADDIDHYPAAASSYSKMPQY